MRTGIIITTIGTVLGGIILSFFPQFCEIFLIVISTLFDAISWILSSLLTYYSMPGWVYLIAILVAILGMTKIIRSVKISTDRLEPEFAKYTEDIIDGIIWRWTWVRSQIHDLNCFCPTCDAQLICSNSLGRSEFICERCAPDSSPTTFHPIGRIIRIINGGDCYYAREATTREIYRRIRRSEIKTPEK